MGKRFELEIKELDKVIKSAKDCDVSAIVRFIRTSKDVTIYCVGSGGSLSVAKTAEFFFIKAGMNAKAITPLELQHYHTQLQKSSIAFFSASGSNKDLLNSYEYATYYEPNAILVCCMRTNSKIGKVQRNDLHNFILEYDMPVKKDGYLAVESLISSVVILSRAIYQATGLSFFEMGEETIDWEESLNNIDVVESIIKKETIIVLHSGISSPAAYDLESKFSEVALGNIQIVDYRNFAHGRHFWLSHRMSDTGVILLCGKQYAKLALRTQNLVPDGIPTFYKEYDDTSVVGVLQSYQTVFQIVKTAGKIHGIDPGKPKVDDFGRKLYHSSFRGSAFGALDENKDMIANAVYRKTRLTYGNIWEAYYKNGVLFLEKMRTKLFKGIVFDYDGTIRNKLIPIHEEKDIFLRLNKLLENGLYIGIATGRGKSVRDELKEFIEEEYWNSVIISYYNGGVTGLLSDSNQPDKKAINVPRCLSKAYQLLISSGIVMPEQIDGIEDNNPYQLTIIFRNAFPAMYKEMLCEILKYDTNVKPLLSDHSIDIVPNSSTKKNILKEFVNKGIQKEEVLCIGDSGQVGGNDYELLKSENGLSVDYVSNDNLTCWNYAPIGYRNSTATEYYLDQLKMEDNGFTIFN